jgi:predicted metal-dependent phosphoesterase TrpH
MKANLHLHSRISDGTDWPWDIAARAAQARLRHIALTDHDSLGGVPEFLSAARHFKLQATVAAEIDCIEPEIDYRSELLAYYPEGTFTRSAGFLKEIGSERLVYAQRVLDRARRHFPGISVSFDELLDRKRSGRMEIGPESFSFSKVDLFVYFRVKRIIPKDITYKAFKKAYLESGLLATGSRAKPLCAQVVSVVVSDGGVVVVPHIGHEFDDSAERMESEIKRLRSMLDYFASLGVRGIELYWYRNEETKALNKIIFREAQARGFFFTYGSDCHGPGSGKETLSLFDGDFAGFPPLSGEKQ